MAKQILTKKVLTNIFPMTELRHKRIVRLIIISLILFVGLFLSSCKSFKSPYVQPARIISSEEKLIESVIVSDKSFFEAWDSDVNYNNYILDVIDSLSFNEITKYADTRYKELAQKYKDTNFKGHAIYVLYCCNRGEVIVKTGDGTRAFLDSVYPGDYYRLVTKKYESASLFLKALKQFFETSQKGYEQLGFFRKKGVDNSILSTLNLKLSSLFIPSHSLLHKLLFSIPFGIGMVFVKTTRSIIWSALVLLLLYFICRMAYQRHKTRAQRFNIITACWLSFSLVYFLAFCCVINSISPSSELMHGLINNNYSQIYQSVYAPYYSAYCKSSVSIFSIILLIIVFVINWFINLIESYNNKKEFGLDDNADDEMSNKVSEFPMTIIALIGGACTCQSSLIYVLIAFLSIRVFEAFYVLFRDDAPHYVSSKPFNIFAFLFLCLSILYTLVKDTHPFFSVVQIHATICWGFMALSAFYLLIDSYFVGYKNNNSPSAFGVFDRRCSFSEAIGNPIVNLVFSDYALFAGITAPLFLIGCILFVVFPDYSLGSIGLTYVYMVGGFILAPCSVATIFIILNTPRLKEPEAFVSELSSVSCMFTTKNEYFNNVIDRAWHFGGLLLLTVALPALVLMFIFPV